MKRSDGFFLRFSCGRCGRAVVQSYPSEEEALSALASSQSGFVWCRNCREAMFAVPDGMMAIGNEREEKVARDVR